MQSDGLQSIRKGQRSQARAAVAGILANGINDGPKSIVCDLIAENGFQVVGAGVVG